MDMNPLNVAPAGRSLRRFVLGLLVGIAGTAAVAAWAQPHGHAGMMGGPGMMMGYRFDHALAAVGASDAQRAQVKEIMQAARADMRQQHEATRALRQQSMQLFTQPTVDANAAEALRQQMLAQHDAASKRMLQAMLDVSRVLTPEQRAKLAERMQQRREMMQRHDSERRQLDTPKQ